MKLYEVAESYKELFDEFDDRDDIDNDVMEAYFDTLESIETEFDDKALNIAMFIKNLTSEAESIKAEKMKLEKRQKSKENKAKHLKAYLLGQMNRLGKKKIENSCVAISTRNNAESVVVSDEDKLIAFLVKNDDDSMFKISKPELNKTEIKKSLKEGYKIPFASLERTQSLIIK